MAQACDIAWLRQLCFNAGVPEPVECWFLTTLHHQHGNTHGQVNCAAA